jgi:probable HAF family extracellular repeat protein
LLAAGACGDSGDDDGDAGAGGTAGSGGSPQGGSSGRGGGSGGGNAGSNDAGTGGNAGAVEAGASSAGETSEGGSGGETASAGSPGGAGERGGTDCVPEYDVVDLGELPPDLHLTPTGVNAAGVVVLNGETRSGVYTDALTDLGLLPDGGTKTFGAAINDAGDIVGKAWLDDIYAHAFLYQDGEIASIAEELGEMTTSEAVDINNDGDILARVDGRWGVLVDGNFELVPQDPTTGGIEPAALNDAGVVVGNKIFDLAAPVVHAALLADGQYVDLGTIEDGGGSQGMALNNAGDAVGIVFTGPDLTSPQHAALFHNGEVIDLGVLSGYTHSVASAINDQGVIVGGLSSTTGSGNKAFAYACGEMIDLNTRIPDHPEWVLAAAYGINESGQIAGFGNLNGMPARRAFRLDPR